MDLTNLPEELIVTILLLLLESGFRHFCRAKTTCKSLRDVASTPEFYRSVDFYYMRVPWTEHWPSDDFIRQILVHNNPSALLLKGVSEYFYESKTIDGLDKIQRASGFGWETAEYIEYMTVKMLYGGVKGMYRGRHLTRESVTEIRKKILARDHRMWPDPVCAQLVQARDNLSDSGLRRCKCAEYDNWQNWWNENVKKVSCVMIATRL